ncbi:MAG: hypothetical protein ACK5TN_05215 [Acidobacteriota bacterium]
MNFVDPAGLARCTTISWERDDNGNRRAEVECISEGYTQISRTIVSVRTDDVLQIARDVERSAFAADLDSTELDYLLFDSYNEAQKMLGDSECASLFGTESSRSAGWHPSQVLGKLMHWSGGVGRIQYQSWIPAVALTSPWVGSSGVTAIININPNDWRSRELASNRQERAKIILQELGHAFDLLSSRGSGGSQLIPDLITLGGQTFNNELIAKNCGIVRPMIKP